jgi:alpha-tubulin suppressor-like RCC1 family protein
MLRIVVIVVVAGCGRIDFNPYGAIGAAACGPMPAKLYLGHRATCYLDTNGARWCAGEGVGSFSMTGVASMLAGDGGWTELWPGWQQGVGRHGATIDEWIQNDQVITVDTDPSWNDISMTTYGFCMHHTGADAKCNDGAHAGPWSMIAAGDNGYAGIMPDGTLWTWGTELGNGLAQGVQPDGTMIAAPTQVGTATDWLFAEIGDNLACAMKTDRTIWCTGRSDISGTNGIDTMGVLTKISPDTDWQWLSVRFGHGCAAKPGGHVYCWGQDGLGLEIVPGETSVPVPSEIGGYTFDTFLMGGHHYCAQMTGSTDWYCWGWNAAGQLLLGDTMSRNTPDAPACTTP